jgi:hypothetical protein
LSIVGILGVLVHGAHKDPAVGSGQSPDISHHAKELAVATLRTEAGFRFGPESNWNSELNATSCLRQCYGNSDE